MRWLSDVWFRIRALLSRSTMESDLDEEVRFHLDMQTRKHVDAGMSKAEAHRRARIEFGGEDRFKEHARDSWGVTVLHDLASDVRYAVRQFARNPAFTAVAALTLALGIGGTVALFSVVDGLMLRPLPVHAEKDVLVFWSDYNWRGVEFDFAKERVQAFEELAAFSNDGYTLRTEAGSSLLLSTVASAELFDVLGTPPLLGRTFAPGDDRPGAEPIAVLSHRLWTQTFGADPDIVGRRINLNGRPTTVVGVMPRDFYFATPDADIYTPLELDPADAGYQGNGWLVLVGRVARGTTDARVQEDLTALGTALGERFDYPDQWDKSKSPYVTPLREYVLGDVRPALLFLLGAVALVLLMACANTAALILTRTVDRTGEMSVRLAMGAGRGRLARQLVTESVTLAVGAGLLGMVLAAAAFDLLVAALPLRSGFGHTLHMDWRGLVTALTLSVLTGVAVALAPMRGVLSGNVSAEDFGTRRPGGTSARGARTQNALVAAEVLLAVVLATGAALLIRTVGELRSLDPGFESAGVLTVDLLLAENETTPDERAAFYSALIERARALPGVAAAGLINRVPIRDGGWQGGVTFQDRPDLDGDRRPTAYYRPVTPETFDALGMTLIAGRGIQDTDREGSPSVAVINQSFARRVWGDEDPIGRVISRNGLMDGPIEVVGVVRDVAIDDLIGPVPMAAYYSWDQSLGGSAYGILMVKTELDPTGLAPGIRSLVAELDPGAAIGRVETMDEVLDEAMAEPLRLRFFLGLFSALGIVLGTVGVYGTVSYSVKRRHAEFGIRMALGAQPGLLLREVVRTGMLPVVVGVLGGAAVALAASSLVSRFLFAVQPTDPASLLGAAAALCAAGILAAAVPAFRASATDPAEALRAE